MDSGKQSTGTEMNDHYAKLNSFFRSKFSSRKKLKQLFKNCYSRDLEKIFRFLVPENETILEIGCSDGSLLHKLKPKEALGSYLVTDHVKMKETNKIKFQESLPESIKTDKLFDYIIYYDSLGYINDIQESLLSIKKNCRKDTRVILTYHSYLWEPILALCEILGLKEKQPIKQNWLSSYDVENLLHIAGFDIVKKGERLLLPVYIPLVSAFLNKYVSQLPLIRKLCLSQYVVARPISKVQKDYSVTVLIPARNEAGNIENAVIRTPDMGNHTEIIFVEGNSTDTTKDEIKRVMEKYKHKDIKFLVQDGKGKGDAVRKGFDHAKGDVLMILDADLTMPPEDLPKFYDAIASGKGEFVNGTRLVYPLEDQAMRFINLMGNKGFSLTFTWLLNQRLRDTLCGTKVLFRSDYEKIKANRSYFGDFDPFGDFDLLFGAAKQNLKIVEVPIRYGERKYGTTNISRFKHGWLLIKMCLFASRKMKFI